MTQQTRTTLRGSVETRLHADAVLDTLNTPQNRDKPHHSEESYKTLRRKVVEESHEAWTEAIKLESVEGEERERVLRDLMRELEDSSAANAWLWAKAREELEGWTR